MYWVRSIEIVFSDECSKKYTYLLCDSAQEFTEDTAGVIGASCIWNAQIGKISRAEAKERQKDPKPLNFVKNSALSPNIKSVMRELGAVISATVINDLYGMGSNDLLRRIKEKLNASNNNRGKTYV